MTPSADPVGQRSETVRRANLGAIVRELHLRGPLSRSELVARTGLTRSAIRGLIGELTAAGLADEVPAIPLGTPGRPSPLVRPEPEGALVLALEIAVDSLAAAIVGLGGEILQQGRMDRPRDHVSVDAIVSDLAGLVERILPDRRRGALIGVGVGVAGVVRRSDGLVSTAPNLGWRDAPVGERLAAGLGLAVPLDVANEADLGAVAELQRGAARGADHLIYLSGEVGVGGGIIVDGRAITGVAGYGGEIGHMPINPAGIRCGCGAIGCFETEVGAVALLRRAGRPVDGGRAGIDAVLASAAAGDPLALEALAETGRWLGLGLAGLVNIFDPRVIVFGGLFEQLYPFIEPAVQAALDRSALRAPRRLVSLVPSALGEDAALVGAAELAFEPLLTDPARWLRPRGALLERASA
ncbi:MAG TPA: ROK family protein [Candidatus Limnocylindrales bacterium]